MWWGAEHLCVVGLVREEMNISRCILTCRMGLRTRVTVHFVFLLQEWREVPLLSTFLDHVPAWPRGQYQRTAALEARSWAPFEQTGPRTAWHKTAVHERSGGFRETPSLPTPGSPGSAAIFLVILTLLGSCLASPVVLVPNGEIRNGGMRRSHSHSTATMARVECLSCNLLHETSLGASIC